MKKTLYFSLIICIIITLLLGGCAKKDSKANIIITNKSSEIISNIAIQRTKQTDAMSGNLKPDEHCYFEMGEQQYCTYKVEFENKDKKVTRSNEFTSSFTLNKDEIININILKDNKGKWSIILEK